MKLRILPLIVCFLISASFTCAQSPVCQLTLSNAPELRGFKLGSDFETVKAGLNNPWNFEALPKPDATGFVEQTFYPLQMKPSQSEGLRSIQLSFLDGRLVTIELKYDASVKWEGMEQFASFIAGYFKIPNKWESLTFDQDGAHARGMRQPCGDVGFAIIDVQIQGSENNALSAPVFIIYRTNTKAIRDRRRAEAEEIKRRAFKP